MNAAIAAGDARSEDAQCLASDFDPRGDLLTADEDGRYRLRIGAEVLPVLFTLVATKH